MPPTHIWRWTWNLLFNAEAFAIDSASYAAARQAYEKVQREQQMSKQGAATPKPSRFIDATVLRGALTRAFGLVVTTATLAVGARLVTEHAFAPFSDSAASVLQISGAGVLLWATLAKQGWNIQTFGGWTVREQVDTHVFRVLYVVGTFFLVMSLRLPT